MPFLQKLKNDSVYCENMYSEAPYTEAALMCNICGQDVLDYNGYMFRYKDTPKTIFEAMRDKGYYTYTTSYEPQCHPSSVKRGIDEYEYMFGYDPAALWSYRLSHFSGLYKCNEITEADYKVVCEIVEDNINSWLEWLIDLKEAKTTTNMIRDNALDFDVEGVLSAVRDEQAKFLSDKQKYVNSMFIKGTSHKFFQIGGFKQNNKAKNRKKMKLISNKMLKHTKKRIRKMNYKLNKRNCKGFTKGAKTKLVECVKKPSVVSLKNFAKALLGTINVLFDTDLNERMNSNYDCFKDGPSCRTHIDHFIEWTKQYNNEKPYFAFLHVNDVHNPEVFFTYDSDDEKLIEKELLDANELLDKIPSDYYGNLTHDLSLKYIDSVIEYLFTELADNNLKDNTLVVLCADHGFSFAGNPMRDSYVVNLFLENYNIPFFITGTEHKNVCIEALCQSKDIPATICDLVDGIIPLEFSGKSVLRGEGYENVIIEYCGGGCPDIHRRELKIAAFNSHWFVGTLGKLDEKLNVTEVYDLKLDPLQYNNLAKSIDWNSVDEIVTLLATIKNRRESIRAK